MSTEYSDRHFWLGINAIPNITANKFKILLDHFPTAEAIWHASLAELKAVRPFAKHADQFVEQRSKIDLGVEIKRLEALGLSFVTLADKAYP